MKATPIGRNSFGVFHDPNSGESIIAAYSNPVDIQPKNTNLEAFTLGFGKLVGISMNSILPAVPISQAQEGSVTGPTGGPIQPAASGVAPEDIRILQESGTWADLMTRESHARYYIMAMLRFSSTRTEASQGVDLWIPAPLWHQIGRYCRAR